MGKKPLKFLEKCSHIVREILSDKICGKVEFPPSEAN